MVTSHQATIEMLTQSSANVFEYQKKLATKSAKKIEESNSKIDKVTSDVMEMFSYVKQLMTDFQNSSNKNVVEVN